MLLLETRYSIEPVMNACRTSPSCYGGFALRVFHFCLVITITWGNLCLAQTGPEDRWSTISLHGAPAEHGAALLSRIGNGEELEPREWESLADQLKGDEERSSLRTLALLAAGLGWFRSQLYFRAEHALRQISSADHPLLEVHLFFLAESVFHRAQYQEAQIIFEQLATTRPNSLWAHRARFRRIDIQALLGNIEGAYHELIDLINRYPEYPYRPEALIRAAELALELGEINQAMSHLFQLAPGSLHGTSAVRARELLRVLIPHEDDHLTEINVLERLTFSERLQRVKAWSSWKNYERALIELKALLHRMDIQDNLWPDAALEEVRLLNKLERFQDALVLNHKLKETLPNTRWKRSNDWWRSEALARLGRFKEAGEAFLQSRGGSRSAGSLARLGMIYFNGALYPEAEITFQAAVDRGQGDDPDLWMPRRLLGWLPYRLGRYHEAVNRFKSLCKNGRGSNHYAHYWWARSVQKLGQEEDAVAIYTQLIKRAPYSFYAYLAQMRLEEVGRAPEVPWKRRFDERASPIIIPPPSPLPVIQSFAREYGAQLPLWEMIYGLTLIGERSWARIYLRSLTEENRAYFKSSGAKRRRWAFAPRFYLDNRDDSQYGIWGEKNADPAPRSPSWAQGIAALRPTPLRQKLLPAYRALGDHYFARRISYYEGPDLTYPEALGEGAEWQRRYPRSFRELVESSAARYSIDPHLIWALMTVESSHNPWAISRVGARGLMQVMPHTGQLSADRLGWPYFGSPLLFEPEVAIEMAAWYFQELIEQFQGQLPLAMAAYNAGPHRVKVWLDVKKSLPLDELIEEIPYAQAREYAKKVTKHLGLYRRIYLGYTGHLFDLRTNPYPRGNINF